MATLRFGPFALKAIALLPVREKTRRNYFSVYKCHIQKDLEDIEITDSTKGLILESPDATRWRITIGNDGALIATSL